MPMNAKKIGHCDKQIAMLDQYASNFVRTHWGDIAAYVIMGLVLAKIRVGVMVSKALTMSWVSMAVCIADGKSI